jgi:hypothetical protein
LSNISDILLSASVLFLLILAPGVLLTDVPVVVVVVAVVSVGVAVIVVVGVVAVVAVAIVGAVMTVAAITVCGEGGGGVPGAIVS